MLPSTSTKKYGSTEQSCDVPDDITLNSQPNESSTSEDINRKTAMSCVGSRLSKLKLEIFAFLYTFSYVLTNVTSTTMILDKVCLVHLGYNSSICDDLENNTQIKNSVEKLATNYQLGHTLIQTAPAGVLACFIGPWSDHYGRKFPIMLALCGMVIDSIGSIPCAYFFESRIEYYFIPAIFTGLFGGSVSILAVIYSYVSDCSTLIERTMKFAFIEMAVGGAKALGTSAGGWIYKDLSFTAVFIFSASGLCLSLIYAIFVIEETKGLDNYDPWSLKIKQLLSCNTFLESFSAIAKRRSHRGRLQVILLIISMCLLVITMDSTGDINYLYAHHQFNWSNTTYSNISAIYTVVGIGMLVFVIPILKYFRITDPYLGLAGAISLLGKCLGVGLSREVAIYHIANVIGIFGGCSLFAGRSRISKVVSEEDIGKIFTFVATAESLLPILTSVLMSQLFRACIEFFPGMPYITLAFLVLLPIGVFSWMACLPKLTYEDISHSKLMEEDIYVGN